MDTLDWEDKNNALPESDPRKNWRVVDILELKTKFNDNVEELPDFVQDYIDALETTLNAALGAHTGNTSNPHSVTKAQVGLSNADNTSDVNKPVSTAQQTAIDAKVANNLTASTTVAPSKTAVNTALDLKLTKASLTIEFPTGTINGVNLVFTLSNAANILILFSDGGALDPNQDYTVVSTTITLVAPPYTAFFALTKS